MASGGTDGADENDARSAPAAARPDDVERGWTMPPQDDEAAPVAPPAEPPAPDEARPGETPAPAEAPPPPEAPAALEEAPAGKPSAPIEAPAPPEAPAATATPAATEAQLPMDLPEAPAAVEPSPALFVERPAPPPLVRPPPSLPLELAAPRGRLVSLFAVPPTKGWFFAGGVAMIAALFVGILIGRGMGSERERAAPPPAPSPVATPPKAVAVPTAPPSETASAEAPAPKAGGTVAKYAPGPFNAQAAKLAIDRVVPRLKGCKQPGEPPGSATVTVTFAPTGRVSAANVTTTRYAGTRTGRCISQRLHEARIPEFTGKPTTVKRGIAVR